MMMKRVMYLSVVVAVSLMATGSLSGQSGKETRNVSGFTEIGFGIAGNLYVKTGAEFSVVLQGDRDYLSEIETIVKNGKLVIRTDAFRFYNNEKADVYITLPDLKGLSVSGSGSAKIETGIKNESLDLSVSGSGRLIASEITTGQFHSSISGSGDIVVNGSGEIGTGDISISGSGSYSGEAVRFKNLEVGVSGSGHCNVNVTESLEAHISGSGNVTYSGNPKIDARVSGSGHVRSK
jgi:hypothetical protein